MNKEDKELLLKDLCARLPYGVKIQVPYEDGSGYFDEIVWEVNNDGPFHVNGWGIEYEYVKPYLFPLSSITKKTLEELSAYIDIKNAYVAVEFFNSHHIDYRGLIEKGLAIDATDKNIY